MKKESMSQKNNNLTKIFKSAIKYFVFIFAFLLVGVVAGDDKVGALATIKHCAKEDNNDGFIYVVGAAHNSSFDACSYSSSTIEMNAWYQGVRVQDKNGDHVRIEQGDYLSGKFAQALTGNVPWEYFRTIYYSTVSDRSELIYTHNTAITFAAEKFMHLHSIDWNGNNSVLDLDEGHTETLHSGVYIAYFSSDYSTLPEDAKTDYNSEFAYVIYVVDSEDINDVEYSNLTIPTASKYYLKGYYYDSAPITVAVNSSDIPVAGVDFIIGNQTIKAYPVDSGDYGPADAWFTLSSRWRAYLDPSLLEAGKYSIYVRVYGYSTGTTYIDQNYQYVSCFKEWDTNKDINIRPLVIESFNVVSENANDTYIGSNVKAIIQGSFVNCEITITQVWWIDGKKNTKIIKSGDYTIYQSGTIDLNILNIIAETPIEMRFSLAIYDSVLGISITTYVDVDYDYPSPTVSINLNDIEYTSVNGDNDPIRVHEGQEIQINYSESITSLHAIGTGLRYSLSQTPNAAASCDVDGAFCYETDVENKKNHSYSVIVPEGQDGGRFYLFIYDSVFDMAGNPVELKDGSVIENYVMFTFEYDYAPPKVTVKVRDYASGKECGQEDLSYCNLKVGELFTLDFISTENQDIYVSYTLYSEDYPGIGSNTYYGVYVKKNTTTSVSYALQNIHIRPTIIYIKVKDFIDDTGNRICKNTEKECYLGSFYATGVNPEVVPLDQDKNSIPRLDPITLLDPIKLEEDKYENVYAVPFTATETTNTTKLYFDASLKNVYLRLTNISDGEITFNKKNLGKDDYDVTRIRDYDNDNSTLEDSITVACNQSDYICLVKLTVYLNSYDTRLSSELILLINNSPMKFEEIYYTNLGGETEFSLGDTISNLANRNYGNELIVGDDEDELPANDKLIQNIIGGYECEIKGKGKDSTTVFFKGECGDSKSFDVSRPLYQNREYPFTFEVTDIFGQSTTFTVYYFRLSTNNTSKDDLSVDVYFKNYEKKLKVMEDGRYYFINEGTNIIKFNYYFNKNLVEGSSFNTHNKMFSTDVKVSGKVNYTVTIDEDEENIEILKFSIDYGSDYTYTSDDLTIELKDIYGNSIETPINIVRLPYSIANGHNSGMISGMVSNILVLNDKRIESSITGEEGSRVTKVIVSKDVKQGTLTEAKLAVDYGNDKIISYENDNKDEDTTIGENNVAFYYFEITNPFITYLEDKFAYQVIVNRFDETKVSFDDISGKSYYIDGKENNIVELDLTNVVDNNRKEATYFIDVLNNIIKNQYVNVDIIKSNNRVTSPLDVTSTCNIMVSINGGIAKLSSREEDDPECNIEDGQYTISIALDNFYDDIESPVTLNVRFYLYSEYLNLKPINKVGDMYLPAYMDADSNYHLNGGYIFELTVPEFIGSCSAGTLEYDSDISIGKLNNTCYYQFTFKNKPSKIILEPNNLKYISNGITISNESRIEFNVIKDTQGPGNLDDARARVELLQPSETLTYIEGSNERITLKLSIPENYSDNLFFFKFEGGTIQYPATLGDNNLICQNISEIKIKDSTGQHSYSAISDGCSVDKVVAEDGIILVSLSFELENFEKGLYNTISWDNVVIHDYAFNIYDNDSLQISNPFSIIEDIKFQLLDITNTHDNYINDEFEISFKSNITLGSDSSSLNVKANYSAGYTALYYSSGCYESLDGDTQECDLSAPSYDLYMKDNNIYHKLTYSNGQYCAMGDCYDIKGHKLEGIDTIYVLEYDNMATLSNYAYTADTSTLTFKLDLDNSVTLLDILMLKIEFTYNGHTFEKDIAINDISYNVQHEVNLDKLSISSLTYVKNGDTLFLTLSGTILDTISLSDDNLSNHVDVNFSNISQPYFTINSRSEYIEFEGIELVITDKVNNIMPYTLEKEIHIDNEVPEIEEDSQTLNGYSKENNLYHVIDTDNASNDKDIVYYVKVSDKYSKLNGCTAQIDFEVLKFKSCAIETKETSEYAKITFGINDKKETPNFEDAKITLTVFDRAMNKSSYTFNPVELHIIHAGDLNGTKITYSLMSNGCTTTDDHPSMYFCKLDDTLLFTLNFDKNRDYFMLNTADISLKYEDGNIETETTKVIKGDGSLEIQLKIKSDLAVSHELLTISFNGISDLNGIERHEILAWESDKDYTIYYYNNIKYLTVPTNIELNCGYLDSSCTEESLLSQIFLNSELVTDVYKYDITTDIKDLLSSAGKKTINLKISYVFDISSAGKETEYDITINKRTLKIILKEDSLTSFYGEAINIEIEEISEGYLEDGDSIVCSIDAVNVGIYLDSIKCNLASKDNEKNYDIKLKGNTSYKILSRNIELTNEVYNNAIVYTSDIYNEATKTFNYQDMYMYILVNKKQEIKKQLEKIYDGSDTYGDYVFLVGTFENGEKYNIKLNLSYTNTNVSDSIRMLVYSATSMDDDNYTCEIRADHYFENLGKITGKPIDIYLEDVKKVYDATDKIKDLSMVYNTDYGSVRVKNDVELSKITFESSSPGYQKIVSTDANGNHIVPFEFAVSNSNYIISAIYGYISGDSEAPTLDITVKPGDIYVTVSDLINGKYYANGNVVITLNASDSDSGNTPRLQQYTCKKECVWEDLTSNVINVSSTGTYKFRAVDSALNQSIEHTVNVEIDTTSPRVNDIKHNIDSNVSNGDTIEVIVELSEQVKDYSISSWGIYFDNDFEVGKEYSTTCTLNANRNRLTCNAKIADISASNISSEYMNIKIKINYTLTDYVGLQGSNSYEKEFEGLYKDNIAPEIVGVSVDKSVVGLKQNVTYTISTNKAYCPVWDEEDETTYSGYECKDGKFTYTTSYNSTGKQKLDIPAGLFAIDAGSTTAYQTEELVTVGNARPVVTIVAVEHANGNKVYYDGKGIHTNKVVIDIAGDQVECNINASEGCSSYLQVEGNSIYIKASLAEVNEYGLSNDRTDSGYVLVDLSEVIWTITKSDNSDNTFEGNSVIVGPNKVEEHKYIFTSNVDIDVNSLNGLTYEDGVYTYTFNNKVNAESVIVKDYLGNEKELITIELDNEGPEIELDQTVYLAYVSQEIEIVYKVYKPVVLTCDNNQKLNGIYDLTCSEEDDYYEFKFKYSNSTRGEYTITIPQGMYRDDMNNGSLEAIVTIVVSNSPTLTPMIQVGGKWETAKSSNGVYYLNDISTIRFNVSLGREVIKTCAGNRVELSSNKCYYEYSNNTGEKNITIPVDEFSVNGVSNEAMTFSFEEYTGIEVPTLTTTPVTSTTKYLNSGNIVFEYTITRKLMKKYNAAPSLVISIGGKEFTLNGTINAENTKLTYTYPISSYEGVVEVVRFSGTELQDLAYNVINNANIHSVTQYIIDVKDPSLSVEVAESDALVDLNKIGQTWYATGNVVISLSSTDSSPVTLKKYNGASSKWEDTSATLEVSTDGTYRFKAIDSAGSESEEVIVNIKIDRATLSISNVNLEDASITSVSRGQQISFKLPLSKSIKSFNGVNKWGVYLTDGTEIGTGYHCSINTSKDELLCNATITDINVNEKNKVYTGIIVRFERISLTENSGKEMVLHPSQTFADLTVNFEYASVTNVELVLKNNNVNAHNVGFVYGTFDDIELKIIFNHKVSVSTTQIVVLNVGGINSTLTCEMSDDKYSYICSGNINISTLSQGEYDIILTGEIKYSSNGVTAPVNVNNIANIYLGSIKHDNIKIVPELKYKDLVKNGENTTLRFDIEFGDRAQYLATIPSCDGTTTLCDSYVNVETTDEENITLISIKDSVLSITYTGVIGSIEVQLKEAFITDELGNTSVASQTVGLNLEGVVASITQPVAQTLGEKQFVEVVVNFNRKVKFASGKAIVTYKFTSEQVAAVSADPTIEINVNREALIDNLKIKILIPAGANGYLELVSIKDENGRIEDINGAVYESLDINGGITKVLADTTGPVLETGANLELKGLPKANNSKYYVNSNGIYVSVSFNEKLSSGKLIVLINGIEYSTSDVRNDKELTYYLPISDFAQGELKIGRVTYEVSDMYDNKASDSDTTEYTIIYDNTSPEIRVTVDKSKVSQNVNVTYTIESLEDTITCSEDFGDYKCESGKYTYTTSYTSNGVQTLNVPGKLFKDLANNPSLATPVNLVTVGSDIPSVYIKNVEVYNGNKVYYDTTHDNFITIAIEGESDKVCNLKDSSCSDYLEVDSSNVISIKAGIAKLNEYGLSNVQTPTNYVLVDLTGRWTIDKDDSSTAVMSGTQATISSNVVKTYTYVFTSNKDIKSVSKGLIELNAGKYTYRFDQTTSLGDVYVYDYLGNSEKLLEIIQDNEGPVVTVSSYYANVAEASNGIDISYTVTGAKLDVDDNTLQIGDIVITRDNTVETPTFKFRFSATSAGSYKVVIPAGQYEDEIGNPSEKTIIYITVSNAPTFTPLNKVDGEWQNAIKDDNGVYYVNDLSTLKFVVKLGNQSITCNVEDCIYTYNNSSKSTSVTIPSNTVIVNGNINSVETTFNFVEYASVSVSKEYSSTDSKKILKDGDQLTFTYTITNKLFNSVVPSLIINIEGNDIPLLGKLENNVLTYVYQVNFNSYAGDIEVVGFDSVNKLYDLANNVVNNVNIKDTNTGYSIDLTPIKMPTLEVIANNCITSVQNGVTYYYCSKGSDIKVKVSQDEIQSSGSLVLKVNNNEVNLDSGEYTLLDTNTGDITISLSGTIKDAAGNETVVNLTNTSYKVEEYSISVKLSDESPKLISGYTGLPVYEVTNSIGIYDDILESLNNKNYYKFICENMTCNEYDPGFASLAITTDKGLNNDVNVSLTGNMNVDKMLISAYLTFIDQNTVTVDGQTISVNYGERNVTIDTGARTINEYSVNTYEGETQLRFNGKDYINDKSNMIINLTFDSLLRDDKPFKVYIGKENGTMYPVKYSATKSEDKLTYILNILNDEIYKIYNRYSSDLASELIIKIEGIYGSNNVSSDYILATDFDGVNYKLHIDREKPVISFEELVDNEIHKLNIENNIIVSDANSGVKSVSYNIKDSLNNDKEIKIEENYISFAGEDYTTGTYTIFVTVIDNVGMSSTYSTKIFIDKTNPVITLDSLHYTSSILEAHFSISDDSKIASERVSYSIDSYSGEVNIIDNKFSIILNELELDIYDSNLKLVIGDIKDDKNNVSTLTTDLLSLNVIEDTKVHLTSNANCIGNVNCNSQYIIKVSDNDYRVAVDDIMEGYTSSVNGTNIIVTSNVDAIGLTLTVTVTSGNISVTYDITLENIIVNVTKVSANNIHVILENGTIIQENSSTTDDSNVEKMVNEEVTCNINKKCSVNITVTDKSGWEYNVIKELDITNIGNYYPEISVNNIMTNTTQINNKKYHVVYADSATVKFSKPENINVREDLEYALNVSDGVLQEITLHYYTDTTIAIPVTYYICFVTNTNVTINGNEYKNSHSYSISNLTDKPYKAKYELVLMKDAETLASKTVTIIDGTCISNGTSYISLNGDIVTISTNEKITSVYTLKTRYYVDLNENMGLPEYEEHVIKLDNYISDTELTSSVENIEEWKQSKDVVISLACDRSDDSCAYEVNGEVVEDNTYNDTVTSNGTYEYVINDDAGNARTIVVKVDKIDTTAPVIDEVTYKYCHTFDGDDSLYCNNPTINVNAKDNESDIENYQFGYGLVGGEITWFENTQINKIVLENKIVGGGTYNIYIKVSDVAKNVKEYVIENVKYLAADIEFTGITVTPNARINHVDIPTVTSSEYITIEKLELCLDDKCVDITNKSGKYDFKEDGKFEQGKDIPIESLYFRATNSLGIVKESEKYSVVIDVTPITIEKEDYSQGALVEGSDGVYYIAIGSASTPEISITTDNSDSVDSFDINYDKTCTTYDYAGIIRVDGVEENVKFKCLSNELNIVLKDKAGNETNHSIVVSVDKVAPVINGPKINVDGADITSLPFVNYGLTGIIEYNYDSSQNKYTITTTNKEGYAISLQTIGDNESGLEKACLYSVEDDLNKCINDSRKLVYPSNSSQYTVDKGLWYIYAKDKAGNYFLYTYEFINVSGGIDFNIYGNTEDISADGIELKVSTDDDLTGAKITWYYKELDARDSDYKEIEGATGSSHTVTENGVYKVSIVDKYGIETIDTKKITNIHPAPLVVDGAKPTLVNESTYFTSKTVIKIAFPNINPDYSINSFSAEVYYQVGIKQELISTTTYYTSQYNSNIVYQITYGDLQELINDTNGVSVKIIVKLKAPNGSGCSEEFDLIYVNKDNYEVANISLLDGDEANIGKMIGTYKHVHLKLESVSMVYSIFNPKYYLVLNGDVSNKKLVSIGKSIDLDEGIYNNVSLFVEDNLGLSSKLSVVINDDEGLTLSALEVDRTIDTINVNESDKSNVKNNAYFDYSAHLNADDSKLIAIKYMDEGHTFSIYDTNGGLITIDNNKFVYPENGFIVKVLDAADNESRITIIVEDFNSEPEVEFEVTKTQSQDGNDATLKLSYVTINVSESFEFLGYKVCEDEGTCDENYETLITDLDISSYVGKYIRAFYKDIVGVTEFNISELISLKDITLAAPIVTLGDTIVSNQESIDIDIVSTSTASRNVYYLIINLDYDVVGFDTIRNSQTFMYAYKDKPNNIVKYDMIEHSDLAQTETLSLNFNLDARYQLFVLAEDNGIYSTVAKQYIHIDSVAPVAKTQGEELVSQEDAIYSNYISVELIDEHSRGSNKLYRMDNSGDYIVYTNKFQITNGSHTLEVCDVNHQNQRLNCHTYNIVIDTANPDITLTPSVGEIGLNEQNTYGYKIKNSAGEDIADLLQSMLVVSEASLRSLRFTFNLGIGNYVFDYSIDSNRFYSNGKELSIPVYSDLIGYYIKWYDNSGVETKLRGEIKTINGDDYFEISGINDTFIVKYDDQEKIESLIPCNKDVNDTYSFSLKLLMVLLISNNSIGVSLKDITRLSVNAEDFTNRQASISYKFDLANPVITLREIITDYKDTLSRKEYVYLNVVSSSGYDTSANYMLNSCKDLSDNSATCAPGLYMQIVKDDSLKSSNNIIQMLKHIIFIDGARYGSYDSANLKIYYNDSMYIEEFVDPNKYLKQLNTLGDHSLTITYTDSANNSSSLYIRLIVEDTITPTVTNIGNASRTLNITDNNTPVYFNPNLSVSDNYYSNDNIECKLSITFNGESKTISCLSDESLYVNNVVVAEYKANESKIAFNVIGVYNIKYMFVDKSHNETVVNYTITVKDTTPITYNIVGDQGVIVDGNKINLGEYSYDIINAKGICLSCLATISFNEKHELSGNYSMKNLILYEVRLANNKIDDIYGFANIFEAVNGELLPIYVKVDRVGTYTVTYRITNSSGKYTEIIYTFVVKDTTPPTIELEGGDDYRSENNENVFIIEVPENNTSLLDQLRDIVLSAITPVYKDNYTSSDALKDKTISCGSNLGVDISNKYLGTYTCTYKVTDSANNSKELTITIHIKDIISPSIEGENYLNDNDVVYTYTNNGTLSLVLPACSDNFNNPQCTRYYSVNDGEVIKYSGKVNITLTVGKNIIKYYTVDNVGNKSYVKYYAYILDMSAPTIDYILTNDTTIDYNICGGLENASICKMDNESNMYVLGNNKYTFLHLIISEENVQSITIYKFIQGMYVSIDLDNNDITDTGLYKVVVQDKAGNSTQREFYVYKETYAESGELNIGVKDSEDNITLNYRDLYLVEYDKKNQTILHHEEAFAAIKKTDGVYVIGIDGNNQYVKLVKYNGKDVYNTATTIKANVSGISGSVINIEGKTYLMMVLVENDSTSDAGQDDGSQTNQTNQDQGKNTSYSWIFYVLGVIGVLGGGFLIMKLRNKIKAA